MSLTRPPGRTYVRRQTRQACGQEHFPAEEALAKSVEVLRMGCAPHPTMRSSKRDQDYRTSCISFYEGRLAGSNVTTKVPRLNQLVDSLGTNVPDVCTAFTNWVALMFAHQVLSNDRVSENVLWSLCAGGVQIAVHTHQCSPPSMILQKSELVIEEPSVGAFRADGIAWSIWFSRSDTRRVRPSLILMTPMIGLTLISLSTSCPF
jgi:hypothetical protein